AGGATLQTHDLAVQVIVEFVLLDGQVHRVVGPDAEGLIEIAAAVVLEPVVLDQRGSAAVRQDPDRVLDDDVVRDRDVADARAPDGDAVSAGRGVVVEPVGDDEAVDLHVARGDRDGIAGEVTVDDGLVAAVYDVARIDSVVVPAQVERLVDGDV